MKKRTALLATAISLTMAFGTTALAAGWQQNTAGWWYEQEDGAYPVNAWFQDPASGAWYHFNQDGYMQTGWIQDGEKHYYLDPSTGAMWANATTPDGYQVDGSGAWIQSAGQGSSYRENTAGWQTDSVGRWYRNGDGSYVKDRWKTISGDRYYFDESGYVTVGFAEIDGEEYYFSDRGVLRTKDFTIDGEVYIVDSSGAIQDVVDEWEYESGDYSGSSNHRDQDSSEYWNEVSSEEDGLDQGQAEEVIGLVNQERKKKGLPTLETNDTLMEACEIRAEELVETYSHTRPDGSRCFTVLEGKYEYMAVGENIAMGYGNPEAVMDGWMNSSGHRANILNKNFEDIGVGCYIKNGTKYWVQLFGAQK